MIKSYSSWYSLITLAHELGQARKRGNPEEIAILEKKLKDYEAVVLASDEMIIEGADVSTWK
jgi:hypothetical protein